MQSIFYQQKYKVQSSYAKIRLSDAYIIEKRNTTLDGTDDARKRSKKLTFKNNTQFRSCISKINNTSIDNAEDFDIVMPM